MARWTSSTVTVSLTINHVDYGPTLDPISPVTTVEKYSRPRSALVGHDVDGHAITYQLTSTPTLGSVQLNGAGVTYTPNANSLGSETLVFTATAGGLTSPPLSWSSSASRLSR